MNLVILASGKGQRLRNHYPDDKTTRPKPMCVFEDKVLLRHVKDTISVTPTNVAITCLAKHLKDTDKIFFKEHMLQEYPDITEIVSVPKARGSGDALLRACNQVDWNPEEPVMVVPCDITGIKYSREDFTAPFIWIKEATEFSGTESRVITSEPNGDIRAIGKKMKSNLVYTGVSGYPSLYCLLRYATRAHNICTTFSTSDIIREIIGDGSFIQGTMNQHIFDIGTPQGQQDCQNEMHSMPSAD